MQSESALAIDRPTRKRTPLIYWYCRSTGKPRTLFADTRSMSNQGSNKMADVGTDAGREQRDMARDEDAKMSEG